MHTLDNSPRAIAYFDDVSRPDGGAEDYFSGRGDKPGRWIGSGLSNVGLTSDQEVGREALHRTLFSGEHPVTGEPLGQRIRESDGIAGFGMTFSAPKSVSLLWALGSPGVAEKVEAAEAAAVDAGIAYLERHAVYARRGRNGIEQIDGGGLIGAAYSHRTSRECDPQLHTHVLVANRTLCEDGRWRTLDSREILGRPETLKAAGAVYQLALRAELTRTLGVQWEPVTEHGQADIAGVPRSLIDAFSKRSAQVRVAAATIAAEMVSRDPTRLDRPPTQRELQHAAYQTRRQKVDIDSGRLHDIWSAEAVEVGWNTRKIENTTLRRRSRGIEPPEAEEIRREVIAELTERESVFRPGHVALGVARRLTVHSAADAVEKVEKLTHEVLSGPGVVDLSGPERSCAGFPRRASDGRSTVTRAGDRVFSVDAVLAEEIRVLELAEAGRNAGAGLVSPHALRWAMAAHDAAFPDRRLGADQRESIAAITGDGQRVSILVGPAGTGKSVTLGVARAAWEASGYRVRGYAPFGTAAASLQEAAAVESEVVAKLLFEQRRLDTLRPEDRDRWEITSHDIVFVDEAGTLSTADLCALARVVDEAGGKLVLAGDRRQLAAVVRGGMFAELERRLGGAELTEVHRLEHPWERDAAMAIRRKDVNGLDAYAAHGRIQTGDRASMVEAVYGFWAAGHLEGHDTLVVARTNEVVDELNRRAQQLLVALARIEAGGAAIAGGAVANVGDTIVTRHPDRRIKVSGPTRYVRNGARWRVLDVARNGDLVAEELAAPPGRAPGRVRLPSEYAVDHARLGYAGTGHSSQGKTVDRVGVLIDGSEDANWLYSAITRGRQGATLFVANEASLLAAEYGKTPRTAREVLGLVVTRDGEKSAAIAELAAAQARDEQVRHLEILATAGRPTADLCAERTALKRELLLAAPDRNLDAAYAVADRATHAVVGADQLLTLAMRRLKDLESHPRWKRNRHDLSMARQAVNHAAEGKRAAEKELVAARQRTMEAESMVNSMAPRRERLELVEAALEVQIQGAVETPSYYLVVALGPRPGRNAPARDAWDARALRLETYRHLELGLGREDGPLPGDGIEEVVGGRPDGYVGRMQWDFAAGLPGPELTLGREVERLGLDL